MKNKLVALLKFWTLAFALPLLGHPALLGHWQILTLLAAWVWVLLSEPAPDRGIDPTQRPVALGALISIWLAVADWAYGSGARPVPDAAFWTGLALIGSGLALRRWSMAVLDRQFTTVVRLIPGHRLVTRGPYRVVRHPAYLGSWLFFVGQGVFLGSHWGVMGAALLLGAAFAHRIRIEESLLQRHFGLAYGQYRRRTWRFFPLFLKKNALESCIRFFKN